MSVTDRFISIGSFPFCLSSATPGDGVVGNLTLAEVMEFFWNLETFTLTVAGTVQSADTVLTYDMGQTLTAFPPGATATEAVMDEGRFYVGSLFPTAASFVAFASLPQDSNDPRTRVCSADALYGFEYRRAGAGSHVLRILFRPHTDDTNVGKYAIAYEIDSLFTKNSGGRSATGVFQEPGGGSGGTLYNTGTITIAGIAFPWEFYADNPPVVNGTLSASSTSFTYP